MPSNPPGKTTFNAEDIGQIAVGAFALSVPIAFSEEAWRLSASLPTLNLVLVVVLSLAFITLFAYQSVFQANIVKRRGAFFLRVIAAYILTLLVVGIVLLALNKLPLWDDPILALKRIILIAMPASMGAIIVDSFDKE
ncbi:MAG: DUF2391 family protein [Shewanella psychromarinicola]|jgi:uncharacterized membrane protein|uniref:DUF2391 family protein n=1 Tax=Shewanella psychromarinicola TaxID=2487742 RepID=A0A3N4E9D6_9GAMM|nr:MULTISPECIES: DUF2391 family protein [Shewanella]AZG34666.1 DUF2391 family protein [Shewanella psychromarinicola]MCL1083065.1 DUF2391 family protein [Shewanella psychromarinicola]PKG79635.1 DUF2391 domain-containing protein [Shewanella sp. Actino-trap-3]RPA33547.1 DUF2391 family protein [Shewanella psychromarinicola]